MLQPAQSPGKKQNFAPTHELAQTARAAYIAIGLSAVGFFDNRIGFCAMLRFYQDAPDVSASAAATSDAPSSLALVSAHCPVCGIDIGEPIGVGEDFEYRTCADSFVAMQCPTCGVVYLNPRPAESEFARIYPANYHAFDFTPQEFGFVFKVRRRLEARRMRDWCAGVPDNAKILDVGCGDGFHLKLLKDFGRPTWTLEGIDLDERAVVAAARNGLDVKQAAVESADLPPNNYDLIMLIMTIEHVADPRGLLARICELLKPGGRVVIVTDNIGSLDFRIFRGRHWGGYHFPRHWTLFDKNSLVTLGRSVGLEPLRVRTATSPVNWVYSIRNMLDDWGAPRWWVNRFSLHSPVSLGFFTMIDSVLNVLGRGSILQVILRKPEVRE
jgi:SAM-dependent methyltransferase